jgi:hypothetical protein
LPTEERVRVSQHLGGPAGAKAKAKTSFCTPFLWVRHAHAHALVPPLPLPLLLLLLVDRATTTTMGCGRRERERERGCAPSYIYISCQQVWRRSFLIFDLFNAAWCVWTPHPRGTQLHLRGSVVGLLRAPLAPHLIERQRQLRLAPLCVSCPLPDSVWPFGCHKAAY